METPMDRWNDDRLDELSQTMKEGFAKVDQRFERIDQRFEGIDRRFEQVPTREEMNQRFDSMERRIDRIGNRIDYMLGAMFLAGVGFVADLLASKI